MQKAIGGDRSIQIDLNYIYIFFCKLHMAAVVRFSTVQGLKNVTFYTCNIEILLLFLLLLLGGGGGGRGTPGI